MFDDIFLSDDENYKGIRNRILDQHQDMLEHNNSMIKLLETLNNSGPLALKEKVCSFHSMKNAVYSLPKELFPAQSALQEFRQKRDFEIQSKRRKHRAAAMLLREWRDRLITRVKRRLQLHLVYQYLLRNKCPKVLKSLKYKIAVRDKDFKSIYHWDRCVRKRAFIAFKGRTNVLIALRRISQNISPKNNAWIRFKKMISKHIAEKKTQSSTLSHSAFYSGMKHRNQALERLVEAAFVRQAVNRRIGESDKHYCNRLYKIGIIALLVHRLRRVRQNSDVFMRKAAQNRYQKVTARSNAEIQIPLKESVYAMYNSMMPQHKDQYETEQARYVKLEFMRRALRKLRRKTIDVLESMACACTIKVMHMYRLVFQKILLSQQRRSFHREVIMEKLLSRKSTILISRLPKTVVLSCILKIVFLRMQEQRNRALSAKKLLSRGKDHRCKNVLRKSFRFLLYWVSSHGGGLSGSVCRTRSIRGSVEDRHLVPRLPMHNVQSGQRSVTITHTPRSVITELTDDIDMSTTFEGGSIFRSSLIAADLHFAQFYGTKYLQHWINHTSHRRREMKEKMVLESVVQHALSVHLLRVVVCWRVYFLFAAGRPVQSSVIAKAILTASGDGKNNKKIRAATDKFTNEMVKRFRRKGETRRWLNKQSRLAQDHWIQIHLEAAICQLKEFSGNNRKLKRVEATGALIKASLAIRKWKEVYLPRAQWLQARLDAANFLICSRYFRVFIDRVLTKRRICRSSRYFRKDISLKFRGALKRNVYACKALVCFEKLGSIVCYARRCIHERDMLAQHLRETSRRRGLAAMMSNAVHSLKILQYVANYYTNSLLKKGLGTLREHINRYRAIAYQNKNTCMVAPGFYTRPLLRRSLSYLMSATSSRKTRENSTYEADCYYLRNIFHRWLTRTNLTSNHKFKLFTAGQNKCERDMRIGLSRWQCRIQSVKIQYSTIRRVLTKTSRVSSCTIDRRKLYTIASRDTTEGVKNDYYENSPDWVEYISEEGHKYFYNDRTGESVWRQVEESYLESENIWQRILPYERFALKKSLRHLKDCVLISRCRSVANRRMTKNMFVQWKGYIRGVRHWVRTFNAYEIKVHINRMKYLLLFFQRWFLNTYPDKSIQKFDSHYLNFAVKFCWKRWFFIYRNGELIQEKQDITERKRMEMGAVNYYHSRLQTASLVHWFNILSSSLAARTLVGRIERYRVARLMKLAMNNLKARADDGYECSVVKHQVDSFYNIRSAQKAVDNLYQLTCSRFANMQRGRVGDILCDKLQKKRALRNLCRHAVEQRIRRQRKQFPKRKCSWAKDERKN